MRQAQRGKNFDESDKARYDKLANRTPVRSQAKEKAQTYQQVQQDNDTTSTVTGDNNYVYQSQDNSIRNYGGDNRVFNYEGNNASGNDTPVSAATMAGYFAPDDSHSANAARLDRQVTQNRDNQKKYSNTSHIAEGAIKRASNNAYIDPAALDKRIADREQYSRSKAEVMGSNIFGDAYGMSTPNWNSAKPQEEVKTPDFDEMYKKYSDFS